MFLLVRAARRFQNGDGETLEISSATRRLFAYVSQSNTLFSGSIRDNLLIVRPDASDEILISALKDACAWDFVSELREGIASSLGEQGAGLSQGQIQRLTIARALLCDTPVLLLDEATSALDLDTERRLIANLQAGKLNRTIILTTHRQSLLSLCNRVYEIKDKTAYEAADAPKI